MEPGWSRDVAEMYLHGASQRGRRASARGEDAERVLERGDGGGGEVLEQGPEREGGGLGGLLLGGGERAEE